MLILNVPLRRYLKTRGRLPGVITMQVVAFALLIGGLFLVLHAFR